MKIRFCRRNLKNGAKPAYRKLKSEAGAKLVKEDCLGSCRLCREACFAVVKGKTLSASGPAKLRRKIKKRLNKR
ncbi:MULTISPECIES: DUF1450 domain-containing protein [unclassified Paenibacillus]|uniref:DUF1450 domain-containing protein n=1 Tax=unclassified Paenibacillus TaxID=185978 RepID=UPI000954E12F|nr:MULTISPECIES: DUF1450 domain-containing protein [unclassified Paenibacillus]ASS65168.1 DUF1450 domain-containing protein [Paenibacillus sp. RUD330]SIQ45648.1 Uncharacterized protein YuzB, UPF0349 family [Paenibacillus sp. RU4X]SIQ67790.1 Uncharacterized protein YuzB, UPF0349 family [Paenibacillus sp. RU4T]